MLVQLRVERDLARKIFFFGISCWPHCNTISEFSTLNYRIDQYLNYRPLIVNMQAVALLTCIYSCHKAEIISFLPVHPTTALVSYPQNGFQLNSVLVPHWNIGVNEYISCLSSAALAQNVLRVYLVRFPPKGYSYKICHPPPFQMLWLWMCRTLSLRSEAMEWKGNLVRK